MANYQEFTTARNGRPDPIALSAAVQTATGDASAQLMFDISTSGWRAKKATAWTAQQIQDVQNALDTLPALTLQLAAQRWIDSMGIAEKATDLALIDALNVLRQNPTQVLAVITPAAAIAAIRAKAGTL
jgi:hypothetical protein